MLLLTNLRLRVWVRAAARGFRIWPFDALSRTHSGLPWCGWTIVVLWLGGHGHVGVFQVWDSLSPRSLMALSTDLTELHDFTTYDAL